MTDARDAQIAICERLSVSPQFVSNADTVGGEELLPDDYFFQPLHFHHIQDWRAEFLPYLALPPGWRFLIAPTHEDAWYDPSLLTPPS
jgi:hypothetical protein